MMKNDITYEYRVFTHRLIDVETMEVGKCTSKVIKELKQKDKVDGRFFHTSDTDEWFFCWNGKLQKLNLKGNADVNAALDEVRELIKKAEISVDNVNKIAQEANNAALNAKDAADKASAAAEKIEDKADKSDVVAVEKEVELKADKSVVESLSSKVDDIESAYSTKEYVDDKVDGKFDVAGSADQALADAKADAAEKYQVKGDYITREELSGKGYATTAQVDTKQDSISDLDAIRSGASAGATALQELSEKGYLTKDAADLLYAPIGTTGSGESIDLSKYAEIEYVNNNFDVAGSADAALDDAKEYADGLVKDSEGKYLFDAVGSADAARDAAIADAAEKYQVKGNYLTEHQSLDNYYTKEQIDAMIGVAIDKTNTILA